MEPNRRFLFAMLIGLTVNAAYALDVTYTISPDNKGHSISPLIYGSNHYLNGDENFGFLRLGGNRTTGYNWENNASSAGRDWKHSSDRYLTRVFGITNADTPGITLTNFQDNASAHGARSLLTLPMAGYVAVDKKGTVKQNETAPSSRWAKVVPRKNSAFSLTPDLKDGIVYIDEMVNFLVNRHGKASQGGVFAYSLDNEPAFWSRTHPRIHPNPVGAKELVSRSIATASAVKKVDPSAKIFGPALFGLSAYINMLNAPDWESLSDKYDLFIDYYLAQMKAASERQGLRLLDVLDLHWYPEATGDTRITKPNANSRKDKIARLQAPRTLWDPNYIEKSWIRKFFPDNLALIPWLQKSIQANYPGTKLSFSEFRYGGDSDITCAIALADVLGIFGKYDVYASAYWKRGVKTSYVSAAYKLYRNYDGANSSYGNISVDANMSDKESSSIYASVDSDSGNLHIIVLNKNLDEAISGAFNIRSTSNYTSGSVYAITKNSPKIQNTDRFSINNNSFIYSLPALSAYHLVLKRANGSNHSSQENG